MSLSLQDKGEREKEMEKATRVWVTAVFPSEETRDDFIDRAFPVRKCAEEPGLYKIPGKEKYIRVFINEVSFELRLDSLVEGMSR
jgi:hypothetical protein